MRRDQLAYLLFAIVGFAQLGTLLLIGDSQISRGGVVLMVLLVAWLGRRSRTAWWLFLIANTALVILGAALAFSSQTNVSVSRGADGVVTTVTHPTSTILWGDVLTVLLGSALLLAILLSRPMRTWVRPAVAA